MKELLIYFSFFLGIFVYFFTSDNHSDLLKNIMYNEITPVSKNIELKLR